MIDGASTDGTPAWLETQHARLAHFSSAPDAGVYDAMNRAVAAARGEWIFFLGADDLVADSDVLSSIAASLQQSSAGVVAGQAIYSDGRRYRFNPRANPCARNFVHHQATFYRRSLFSAHGGFDLSFKILADYEFNLRLIRAGIRFEASSVTIATCGTGGLSDSGNWRVYAEEIHARHRHYPAWRCLPWDALSVARYLRKKIIRSLAKN